MRVIVSMALLASAIASAYRKYNNLIRIVCDSRKEYLKDMGDLPNINIDDKPTIISTLYQLNAPWYSD